MKKVKKKKKQHEYSELFIKQVIQKQQVFFIFLLKFKRLIVV